MESFLPLQEIREVYIKLRVNIKGKTLNLTKNFQRKNKKKTLYFLWHNQRMVKILKDFALIKKPPTNFNSN